MKKLGFFLLSRSVFNLFFSLRNRSKLKILAYHGVDDRLQFRKQVEYLSKHYSFISLETLIDYYAAGKALPRHPLLITFDDGKMSVFDNAFPVLSEYAIPAVVFVCPEIINTKSAFWWEAMEIAGDGIIQKIKKLPWDESEKIISGMKGQSKSAGGDENMSWKELEIINEKGISIANHTLTHPILPNCGNEREFRELNETRIILNDAGYYGNILAYPNGDYSDRTVDNARKSGIDMAFAFDHRVAELSGDRMTLSRLRMRPSYGIDRMRIILSGFYPFLLRLSGKIKT